MHSLVLHATAFFWALRPCDCIGSVSKRDHRARLRALQVIVSVSALLSQIKGLSGTKKARKGFGGSGSSSTAPGTRFSIELPLPSDSPPELVELTGDILAKIPTAASAWTVFASEQAASAAAQNRVLQRSKVLSLQQACRVDSLNGPLLLVAPTTADVALVEQLLDEVWSGPWALLVNPSWHVNTPAQYQPLVGSFNTVYSFMPIATQGLMRVEGAVVHHVSPGSKGSSSSPWRVLVKEGEHFVQVGQMQKRPEPSDLELVLINARAAKSPLTSFVKGVKGMLDRGKK
eukprot:GHUV01057731.1.p1 GENE.GHUV01057731.1~~GHUV01057731.1.p1  ORF type:complete len:288 (+),score=100.13 GHUV01057731.1:340-1203(+)